ncbi:hypothetical protein ACFY3E_42030 [Streptomyces griseorubiginosus]|uniref:hypothetical protein n=1 Tax=Streptomyces griseorubiginosus TaxID=67304 RepID=UPI0036CA22B2
MNDHLALISGQDGDSPPHAGWHFSIIPPKDVWVRWYRHAKTLRRPAGSLALPAIATTGTLHFTHVLHHSDTLMALALTTLTVGYDAVITICRTWQKTAAPAQHNTTSRARQAA